MKLDHCIPVLVFALILNYGCQKNDSHNELPSCTISSPDDSATLEIGKTISILVDAEDADGTVVEVMFSIDTIAVSSVASPPYRYDWNTTGAEKGSHSIKVTAKDNNGGMTTSEMALTLIEQELIETGSDTDGDIYTSVVIGTQTWMAKNLDVTSYPNGDAIRLVTDIIAWDELSDDDEDAAYCYYNNNANHESFVYGALYTFAAAIKVCPTGWHLPTDEEWTILENYISSDGHNGAEGAALKAHRSWSSDGGGTDNYGFSALPAGSRFSGDGQFYYLNNNCRWWSSTERGSRTAYYRSLSCVTSTIYRGKVDNYKSTGCSVRCLKD